MSVKAIRKALKYLKDNDLDEELAAAEAEVAAIQFAARVLIQPSAWTAEDWTKTTETITALAEEPLVDAQPTQDDATR